MKRRGLTLAELAVVTAVMTFLAGVLTPGLRSPRARAIRLVCQTNLQGIGRGMIAFANENSGAFPRAGGPGAFWSTTGVLPGVWYGGRNFLERVAFRQDADGMGGKATMTSSFYVLIKHAMAKPKHFVCPGDKGAQVFDITKTRPWARLMSPKGRTIKDVFDFGGANGGVFPGEYCSYAYHMPYCDGFGPSLAITDFSHPASPVCADRNPHLDKNAVAPEILSNSMSHARRGQNVLYRDGSVKFETSVTVGLGGDNIYTHGEDTENGGGDPNGIPPVGNGDGAPMGLIDAYLVGEQNYP
jgi:type II secretory pathway pseudopilin PulG